MSVWKGPQKCNKCGCTYPAGVPGGQCRYEPEGFDRCTGHLIPYDRRILRGAGPLAEAAPEKASGEPWKRWRCKGCGAVMEKPDGTVGNAKGHWVTDGIGVRWCGPVVVEVTPAREAEEAGK